MLMLNTPMIDYLTLTSFDDTAYRYFESQIEPSWVRKTLADIQQQQYIGYQMVLDDGTLFLGSGKQRDRDHTIIRISGASANRLFPKFTQPIVEGWSVCSRIDLQITTTLPDRWSQWELLQRIKKRGLTPGYRESRDRNGRELSTVYAGSRKSSSFSRTYIKKADMGALLLRFEVQYNKRKAVGVAREIARNRDRLGEYLRTELPKTDERLTSLFLPFLTIYRDGQMAKEIRPEHKTAEWLITQVLPSFKRVINDHDEDGRVMAAFLDAIESCQEYR